MKKTLFLIAVSVVLVILLLTYPFMHFSRIVKTERQYKQSIYNKREIPADNIKYNTQDSRYIILYTDISNIGNFSVMADELLSNNKIISVDRMNMNPEFVSDIYSECRNPEYEYIEESNNGITNKRISILNGKSYKKTKGNNLSSYTLIQYFAQAGLLSITDGRMIDFSKTNTENDAVEIIVTDGMGYSVGDILFIVLNALNEDNEQVFLKAEVVGITTKGVFLPCYPGYLEYTSTVKETYDKVFNTEMIYLSDIRSLYTNNYGQESQKEQNTMIGITTSFFNEEGVSEFVIQTMEKYGCSFIKNNTYGISNLDNYEQSQRDKNIIVKVIILSLCIIVCIIEAAIIYRIVKRQKRYE